MRRRVLVTALLATVVTVSGAQASPGAAYRSGTHEYVLGRFAWSSEDLGRAAGYFAGALQHSPNDPQLLRRTFELAIAAGDEKLALQLAQRLSKSERFDSTAALLTFTDAIKRRDWDAADSARKSLADSGFAAFVAPVLEAWTLYGRSREREAIARLDPAQHEGFAKAYITEHRAHLLAADKRYGEAAEIYASLLAGEGAQVTRLRLAAASALQAAGRADDAKKILESGSSDPAFAGAIARLAAGQPIGGGVTEPRSGVAELFSRMAADLSRERPVPIALVFARLATFLMPTSGDAQIMVADVLSRGGQYEAALKALESVRPDDASASLARARRAAILEETDRPAESLALLQQAVTSGNPTMEDWARLGDVHRRAERHLEAADAYGRAIAAATTPTADHWQLYFLRGTAYEQAGKWPAAEADLRRALALAPNEPTVLNYLGYSLLDRSMKIAEAEKLIERAVELRPDDGYIVDSLGWAHFRAGRYAQAVETLEKAIAEVPGDATINEHLGDAYWKVGRTFEARFRWQAALDSEPTDEQKKRVTAKLDFGLDRAALASARSALSRRP